tara:strand:+ start:67 stop:372 length:306 start_codon:yes stop_codon:yes gene_type:complete
MRYNKNVEASNTRRPPVSSGIEEHTKVGGPKGLVNGREVEAHLGEMFYCMMGWLESEISHLAEPKVHSLCSPVSILTEEASVSVNQGIECASVGRNIVIVH